MIALIFISLMFDLSLFSVLDIQSTAVLYSFVPFKNEQLQHSF
jgi:hypothetical protein